MSAESTEKLQGRPAKADAAKAPISAEKQRLYDQARETLQSYAQCLVQRAQLRDGELLVAGFMESTELDPCQTTLLVESDEFDSLALRDPKRGRSIWFDDRVMYKAFTARKRLDARGFQGCRLDWVRKDTGETLGGRFENHIPRDLAAPEALPEPENISRVIGKGATVSQYLIRGYTIFRRIEDLLRRSAGVSYRDRRSILDWGCGCGRLSRYFLREGSNGQHFVGCDVDAFNVEWCQTHLDGAFELLDLHPPTPFADDQFDLVVGVSVMTHLTEVEQHRWLRELQRICMPGAVLALTFNGEFQSLTKQLPARVYRGLLDRGIDASLGDGNLGPHLPDAEYYRATLQTTEHVRTVWSEYFDVLAIDVAVVHPSQSTAVLRSKKAVLT